MKKLQVLHERYWAKRAAIRACLNLILAAGLLAGLIALPVQARSLTAGADLGGLDLLFETDPLGRLTGLIGLREFSRLTWGSSAGTAPPRIPESGS
jgi:hypothetical protein